MLRNNFYLGVDFRNKIVHVGEGEDRKGIKVNIWDTGKLIYLILFFWFNFNSTTNLFYSWTRKISNINQFLL